MKRKDIIKYLDELDKVLKKLGKTVDLSIYGGAAISLSFDSGRATKDVGAVFLSGDGSGNGSEIVRKIVLSIASKYGLPSDWLNDGVKGFVSEKKAMMVISRYGGNGGGGGIRVFVPTAEYLFAMKCMAMRGGESGDIGDIILLAKKIGVTKADDMVGIVEKFYPRKNIQPKVWLGIQEIAEILAKKDNAASPPGMQ